MLSKTFQNAVFGILVLSIIVAIIITIQIVRGVNEMSMELLKREAKKDSISTKTNKYIDSH